MTVCPEKPAAPSKSGLEIRGVRRRVSDAFLLEVDHLAVPPGRICCVLGPTGAGKSTLLKVVAGLEPPDHGAVCRHVVGELAFVPQRPILLRGTVRQNIEVGLRFRRLGSEERRRRTEEVARQLELRSLLDRPVRGLSGGETRLVALARALVLRPAVLLVDEPTSDLDPGRGALVERVLRGVVDEQHITVLWTTHNLFQARRVAHHVVLLYQGRVVEAAPSEQFFSSPQHELTRRFLRGDLLY